MTMHRRVLSVLFGALGLWACGQPDPGEQGEVLIGVSASGATASDIVRAVLTISGPGITPDIVVQLSRVGTQFRGIVSGIPVGVDRAFHVDAYDGTGALIFVGDATGVTVVRGTPVSVAIVLRQAMLPPTFVNRAPVIDALIASAVQVVPGALVNLRVTAHDPDPADTLTYAWTATGGSFSATAATLTQWTAPAAEGAYTLTMTVTDPHGAAVSLSQTITVQAAAERGNAEIIIDVNNWPEVLTVVAAPGRVDVLETSQVTVTATDLDGDPLTYLWQDNCGGTFSLNDRVTQWTAPAVAPSTGICELTVEVRDSSTGLATGRLTLEVGPPLVVDVGPQLLSTYQSTDQVNVGDPVTLEIQAVDPDGLPLMFGWNATAGTLGVAVETSTSSRLVWQATSPRGFPVLITATARDVSGQEIQHYFYVSDLGVAFYVTPTGDDSASGTLGDPMQTLQAAINRAASDPVVSQVRATTGIYNENPVLTDGVSIFGGFDPVTWQTTPGVYSTVNSPSPVGLWVTGYAGTGFIEGFDIRAAGASGASLSSRGVVLRDITGSLTLSQNRIESALGGPGSSGGGGFGGGPNCTGGGGGSCNTFDFGVWGAPGGSGVPGANGGVPLNQALGGLNGDDWRALAGYGGTSGGCGSGGNGGGGNLCCLLPFGCTVACGGNGGNGGGGGGGGAGGLGGGGSFGVLAINAAGVQLINNVIVTGGGGPGGSGGPGGPGGPGTGGAAGVFCFAGSGGNGGEGGPGGWGGPGAGGAGGASAGIVRAGSPGLISTGNIFQLGSPGGGGSGGSTPFGTGAMGASGIQAEDLTLF